MGETGLRDGGAMTLLLLSGCMIGVTADRRAQEQIELLERRGARVLHGPVVRTLPLGSEDVLRSATLLLAEQGVDFLVANTGMGMRLWSDAAASWLAPTALAEALSLARVVARGHKAATVVESMGLEVWQRAADERLDSVRDILLAEGVEGARVAVQLHGADADAFVQSLRGAGAEVLELPVYEWRVPEDHAPGLTLARAAIEGSLDAVTFTAAPAVRNLFAMAEEAGIADDLRAACNESLAVACVGPVCAEAAVGIGVVRPIVPHRSRLGTMVRVLVEHLAGTDTKTAR